MFERRLRFLRLLVGGLFTLFTYALLVILVLAKSDGLSLAYKFMLLADVGVLTLALSYERRLGPSRDIPRSIRRVSSDHCRCKRPRRSG